MTKARDLADYTGLQGDLALKSPVASPVFTGNVGIGGTPTAHLSVNSSDSQTKINITDSTTGATATDGLLLQSGAANAYLWNYEAGNLIVGNNNAEAMRINADGIVTKPLQPAFQARTGSVANLPINQNYTVPYGTEVFDQNADYNPATYTFTAPVTGKYQLNASIYLNNVVVASGYVEIFIATSNRIYYSILSVNGFDTDLLYFTMPHTVLADMDAGDTAVVGLWIASGSQTADLHGQSYFSGYLVC
jgi:hypothetical protein